MTATPTHPSTPRITAGGFPRMLTMEEVAEVTRMPLATLRYYRATERGPKFAKIGGRLMAREADVLDWLNEQFDAADAG